MKIVSCGDDRERYLLWEEFNDVSVLGTACLGAPNIVASVVFHVRANAPSIYAVERICDSLFGLEMNYGFCAWWSKWSSAEIKCVKVVCRKVTGSSLRNAVDLG